MKPYIFCEAFAGSAALTYYLLGGKPPISYMGGKSGYAAVICQVLGLSQRNKPAGIVLCEPGPFAAVHATLGGASGNAEDVAAVLVVSAGSHHSLGESYKSACSNRPHTCDGYHPSRSSVAASCAAMQTSTSQAVANIIRSWKDEEPRELWNRLKAKGWPSLLLPEGCRGRWLGPDSVEEVAAYFAAAELAAKGDPAAGYAGEQERHDAGRCWTKPDLVGVATRTESLPTFPALAVYQGLAEDLVLPADLSGCYVLMDPPYKGDLTGKITGYKHGDCSRETVLSLARDYSRRGAVVAICESVRLDADLGEGWYAVDISHARSGQVRSFTKNQGSNKKEPQEWVTLNRPPQYIPPKQQGLFG